MKSHISLLSQRGITIYHVHEFCLKDNKHFPLTKYYEPFGASERYTIAEPIVRLILKSYITNDPKSCIFHNLGETSKFLPSNHSFFTKCYRTKGISYPVGDLCRCFTKLTGPCAYTLRSNSIPPTDGTNGLL